MALGRQGERQTELMVGWAELPRSPGHVFYDRLQTVLLEAGFDGFAEAGSVGKVLQIGLRQGGHGRLAVSDVATLD